jgi:SAM-dependent methyltransferase
MQCRSCGAETTLVLSLGDLPLANSLLTSPQWHSERYPLDLMFCPSCKLGQLADVVQPVLMFNDYPYYSSVSGPTVESAHRLASQMVFNSDERNVELAVEIGSNDGYLLSRYKELGVSVLGIDPASGPANAAALKGIPTVQDFFTLRLARTLPKADVIHAHNVLAHVPDLNDFVAGIAEMLKPDGVCVVEVPYLGDMVEKCLFDTLYHEHSYYFSIYAVVHLFYRYGMPLKRLERIPAHGGSLRLFFGKDFIHKTVMEVPDERFDFSAMHSRVKSTRVDFQGFLAWARHHQRSVWGYGAAAKATIMLNYCGIDQTQIAAIADTTPAKIGKYIPGTGIQIQTSQDWLDAAPDYTCIFAWNYEDAIRARYPEYKGQFFTPYALPEIGVSA